MPLCCHERSGGVSEWREVEKEKENEWNVADLDGWALWEMMRWCLSFVMAAGSTVGHLSAPSRTLPSAICFVSSGRQFFKIEASK